MNILNLFGHDEYKQQQIARFIVEGALLQFISSFIMMGLYISTSIEPLFLLFIPFALFLFYCIIRYMLSGIEFTDVFTEHDYKKMKKRNFVRAGSILLINGFMFYLIGTPLVDSFFIACISGFLMLTMETISLRNSYKKNKML